MANVNFLTGTQLGYNGIATKDAYTFYFCNDTGELYLGEHKLTSQDELETLITRLDANESTANSIRNIAKSYIDALDTSADVPIASVSENVVTLKAGLQEVDGIISNTSDSDIVLEEVAVTGAAEDVSYDNTTSELTATDVQAAIDEVAAASAGGVSSKTVYMVSASTSGTEYAAIYNFYQGDEGDASDPDANELIGTINVKKDQFVDEASVVDITFDSVNNKLMDGTTDVTALIKGAGVTPTAADAGKYAKLIFAVKGSESNKKDTIYFSLREFVDIYTGGSTSEITVSIDNNNVVTADVVDVAASKVTYIAADAEHSVARESVGAALARLDGSDSTTGSVSKKVKDAVDALDAVADATKTAIDGATDRTLANSDGVFVLQSVTEADGKLSAMGVAEVAQIGSGTGRSGSGTQADPYVYDDTIVGAKKLAQDLFTEATDAIDGLDVTEFALAEKDSSTGVVTIHGISETDGEIAVGVNSGNDVVLAAIAGTGAAADVAIADAGSYTNETDVEGAIQELYGKLTWGSFPSNS